MGFFDALFGRTRLQKPDMDRLFALSTAAPDLTDRVGVAPDGAAGVCLQPVEGADFAQAYSELRDLVALACRDRDFGSAFEITRDPLGYTWVVFRDPDIADLVTLVHLVGSTLQEKGFGEQLLAAVFRLRPTESAPPTGGATGPVYLIYNYKRGRFYPFVPRTGRDRDNAVEFRLGAALGDILPVERDLSRWFALWDCPV